MRFRHHHAFGLGVIVAGVIAGLIVLFLPSRKIAPDRQLQPADRLPEAARAALKTQMRAHGRGLTQLEAAMNVLDYAGVAAAAHALLAEPRVARPVGGGDATQLNAQLPERFFTLQDELRTHLQQIETAAERRDPDALADAYGAAAGTCVRCHDAYLTGR